MAGANPALNIRVAANLAELRRNLAEGKNQLEVVASAMGRVSQGLTGDAVIRAAHNMTAAIGGVEKASTLTDKEMRKVNRTLDEAIQKYERLGKQAPPAMIALRDATAQTHPALDKTRTSLDTIWSGLKGAAGLMGVAFSAGAIVNFTTKVFAAASSIDDMSKRLGVSAEFAQKFKFGLDQTGSSIEAGERALGIMNRTLAEGNKSTIASLGRLNIEFADIRAKRPEDAFLQIVRAAGQIADPMERAAVMQDLFGRGAIELMPLVVEGYDNVTAAASTMSDETVRRLADAEDAWQALWDKVTIASGEIIAHVLEGGKSAGAMSSLVAGYAGTTAQAMEDSASASRIANGAIREDINLVNESIASNVTSLDAKDAADARAAKSAEAHATKIRALADAFSGAAIQQRVDDVAAAYNRLTPAQIASEDTQRRLTEEVKKLVKEGALLPPVLQNIARDIKIADLRALELKGSFVLLKGGLEEFRDSAENSIAKRQWWDVVTRGLLDTEDGMQAVDGELLKAERDAGLLERAFATLGLNSSASLRQFAREAEQAYKDIQADGTSTPEDIEAAWWVMIDAQREAAGISVHLWDRAARQIYGIFDKLGFDINGIFNGVLTRVTGGFLGGLTKAVGDWAPGFLNLLGNLGDKSGGSFVGRFVKTVFGFDLVGMIERWTGGSASPYVQDREKPSGGGPDPDNPNVPEERYDEATGDERPEFDEGQNVPNFDVGTFGRFKNFGSGTLARLHGLEAVIPRYSVPALSQDIARSLRPNLVTLLDSGSSRRAPRLDDGGVTITVKVDASKALFLDKRTPKEFEDVILRSVDKAVRRLQLR